MPARFYKGGEIMKITPEFIRDNDMYPLLIMGGAVSDFKKSFSGSITRLSDINDVRGVCCILYINILSR